MKSQDRLVPVVLFTVLLPAAGCLEPPPYTSGDAGATPNGDGGQTTDVPDTSSSDVPADTADACASTEEVCDGHDNDCDGEVDEELDCPFTALIGKRGNFERPVAITGHSDTESVYVAGTTDGAFAQQEHAGEEDMFLAKLDARGNVQWVRLVGSTRSDMARDLMAADGESGGVYLLGDIQASVGENTSTESGHAAFLGSYAPDGATRWLNSFEQSTPTIPQDASRALGQIAIGGAYERPQSGENPAWVARSTGFFTVRRTSDGTALQNGGVGAPTPPNVDFVYSIPETGYSESSKNLVTVGFGGASADEPTILYAMAMGLGGEVAWSTTVTQVEAFDDPLEIDRMLSPRLLLDDNGPAQAIVGLTARPDLTPNEDLGESGSKIVLTAYDTSKGGDVGVHYKRTLGGTESNELAALLSYPASEAKTLVVGRTDGFPQRDMSMKIEGSFWLTLDADGGVVDGANIPSIERPVDAWVNEATRTLYVVGENRNGLPDGPDRGDDLDVAVAEVPLK